MITMTTHRSWSTALFLLCIVVLSFAAEHASSFSPISPVVQKHASISNTGRTYSAANVAIGLSGGAAGAVVQKHAGISKTGRPYSAADVALGLSGGAAGAAGAVGAEIGGILGGINAFYLSYPLISAVTTCSVKGSLADFIAQKRNSADGDNNETKPTKEPFSFRRNAAYILYGGGILGVFCDIMYNFAYPFLFGGLDGIIQLIAIVSFDNIITAPLLWLPPVYFVRAILYGDPLKSGFRNYIDDIKLRGLLTKYWAVWWPAQIVNFSLVPAHLRIAFMAGVSFFWLIILSCVSSNSKKKS